MTREQRRRVRDVFEAALDQRPAERGAWIDRAASDDPAVRDEVRSLIEHEARAGAFLERPVLDRVPELMADDGLAPGAIVGAYTIVREIGRGGMGLVYLASDRRLGRTVALKALAPHLTRDERQRDRLRREARAAASLTHPGICTVFALEEIDGALYIASEFVDGRTLRDEMQSTPRPAGADVWRAARDLASALASAHERGITHRDLKPDNVMRTSDGRLKILDFGLAKHEAPAMPPAALTSPGMLMGTPAYMAPEQLKGEAVDRRADVFAFGVLLYEYASGAHPFQADSPLAMMARVLEVEPPLLAEHRRDLPAGLGDIIARCLRKAPADRFQSAADIAAALDRADGGTSRASDATWWRVHQCVVAGLYVAGAATAWQLKEWVKTPTTTAIFMTLGVGATVGCVLRGHMLFTERVNRSRLAAERRRTAGAMLAVDIVLSIALLMDALLLAARPLTAVLTIGLAVGIVLAAALIEPATARAAFGDDDESDS